MAEPPPLLDTDADAGTPRWVKIFGIIALIVILLFVILMFTRGPGGRHGPARHMGSANADEQPQSSITASRNATVGSH